MKILFFSSILMSASVAAAQPIEDSESPLTGSRIIEEEKRDGLTIPPERGRLIIDHVARCSVNRNPSRVQTLIKTPPGSAEERKVIQATINTMSRCFPTSARATFSQSNFRGILAEYLFKRNYGDMAWSKTARPLVPKDYVIDSEMNSSTRARIGWQSFAACVVQKDPAGAANFVMSKVETKAEMAALKLLVPHMGPCLPSNLQISITPDSMRPVMAEEVYRYADVQALGSGSHWAVRSKDSEVAK